jgi:hypothetical protein
VSSSKKKRKKRAKRRAVAVQQPAAEGEGAIARDDRARVAAKRRVVGRPVDERPPAPWGSFPLVELVVLAGILLLIAGFIVGESKGFSMIVSGLVLAALGGLELSVREHFAGFRSHTALLAGAVAMIVLGVLFYLAPDTMPPAARVAVAVAVFALMAWWLSSAFRKRTGVAFKLR